MPTTDYVVTTSNKPAVQPCVTDVFRTGLSRVGYYGPVDTGLKSVWKRVSSDDVLTTTWTRVVVS